MGVEAGTGFALVIVVVTMNIASVHLDQVVYQLQKGRLLLWRSGVFGFSRRIKPTNITYPNRMSVVPNAVSTSPRNWPTPFDSAIQPNDIVVPDIFPAFTIGRR